MNKRITDKELKNITEEFKEKDINHLYITKEQNEVMISNLKDERYSKEYFDRIKKKNDKIRMKILKQELEILNEMIKDKKYD